MRSISFTVTNDLSQDQRMNRICSSLVKGGYHATLIGRTRSSSLALVEKGFEQKRLSCFFEKGKIFYLEYNIKLFFSLLFSKYDAYCAIDLDTILPNFLVAKIKGKPLIYDAHEYFTELEEVVSRPFTRSVWKFLERWIVPKVDAAYTVSKGYKDLFESEYSTRFNIIRNATMLNDKTLSDNGSNENFILYQGAVNKGRGLENVIRAMKDVNARLVICGQGDVLDDLKLLTKELELTEKIDFKGFVRPEELVEFTKKAKIGLTLFDNAGLSNQYSLANRFFDYMHSCIPQLAMKYQEYENFNSKWEIALLLKNLDVNLISEGLNKLLEDVGYYNRLEQNCLQARKVNCWQEEEKELLNIYKAVFDNFKA